MKENIQYGFKEQAGDLLLQATNRISIPLGTSAECTQHGSRNCPNTGPGARAFIHPLSSPNAWDFHINSPIF